MVMLIMVQRYKDMECNGKIEHGVEGGSKHVRRGQNKWSCMRPEETGGDGAKLAEQSRRSRTGRGWSRSRSPGWR